MENSDRIVSLNTMQKPSQEIVRVVEQSKRERNKVFQVGTTYIYNGRTLAFFSKKLREIDGKVTCAILTQTALRENSAMPLLTNYLYSMLELLGQGNKYLFLQVLDGTMQLGRRKIVAFLVLPHWLGFD